MRRVLLATSILLVVAGCTRYWARPGATEAETRAVEDRCETEAITRFPLVPASVPPGYGSITPFGGAQCSLGPTGPTCVTYDAMAFDANGQSRSLAFRACMVAAGWRPAKDEAAAEAMSRRHTPLGPPVAVAIREAWTWCDRMFNERRNAGIMAAFNNNFNQCVATRSRDID